MLKIRKTYVYDLYLVNLDEKSIKQFRHGEYVYYGGGGENDVNGDVFYYTYSEDEEFQKEKESIRKEYMKWFEEKANVSIDDKDICVYYFGDFQMDGWNGIAKEWSIAFIASDKKYYEVYYSTDGTKKHMKCAKSNGNLMRVDDEWD